VTSSRTTLSFDFLGNCGHTSQCGGFVYFTNGQPQNFGWILSDTPYGGIPNFPDTLGTWEHVSYTFADGGGSSQIALEDWAGSLYAAPGAVFFRDMVLTDNPGGIPLGTLSVTPLGAPSPAPGAGLAGLACLMLAVSLSKARGLLAR